MEKKLVSGIQSGGDFGMVTIEIYVGMSKREINDKDYIIISDCCDKIKQALINQTYELDENLKLRGEKEKQELIDLFKNHSLIFVKEIPNQYECVNGFSKHFPWLEITTTKGIFTIGWRKRVIQIDWSHSIINIEAKNIFSSEDVTMGDKYIHAWGIEKAQEYIDKLFI
ncbi:hypothetical protein M0Q97_07065 [Candidatus Dojkabacteria bacterium]|jgi:hypothetical protein|nr:hypothetical protein [Candidatus Dojkabacteria bacterium]